MPHIVQNEREPFDYIINQLPNMDNKGKLEYVIVRVMAKYMRVHPEKYSTLHETVYAVVHAAHEFERRRLDKREDEAIKLNGDACI